MPAIELPPPRNTRALAGASWGRRRTSTDPALVRRLAPAGLALALALTGCTAKEPQQPAATMPTTQTTPPAGLVSSAPLETARSTQTLPVYWLGRNDQDVFLYREFFSAKTTDEPMVAALRTMMGTRPLDPDYYSLWNAPSRLGVSISAQNVITVDVSADAFGQQVDQGIAERSIAQLVYTATAAAAMAGLVDSNSTLQVAILVDGHTGYKAFGHVPLDKPLTRDPALVAPVWIIDPAEGRNVGSLPLAVEGQGVSTTGTLAWSLAPVAGDPAGGATVGASYLDGTVSLANGPGQLGGFSFTLLPPPGRYELAVYINDPAMPGIRRGLDTKIVNITKP